MTANDLIELIVREWEGKATKIVYHIRMRGRIRIDADCTRKFILTATNVEDLFINRCGLAALCAPLSNNGSENENRNLILPLLSLGTSGLVLISSTMHAKTTVAASRPSQLHRPVSQVLFLLGPTSYHRALCLHRSSTSVSE